MNIYYITLMLSLFSPIFCSKNTIEAPLSEREIASFFEKPYFPRKSFDNIRAMAKKELDTRKPSPQNNPVMTSSPNQKHSENLRQLSLCIQLAEENEKLRKRIAERKKIIQKLGQEILQEKTSLNVESNEKNQPTKQTVKKTTQNSKNLSAKSTPAPTLPLNQQKNASPTGLEVYKNATKPLMNKMRSKSASELCDKLYAIAGSRATNENQYFCEDLHVLFGAINKNWSYAYCPCTSKIQYMNTPYENLSKDEKSIPNQSLVCPNKCRYYNPKNYDVSVYLETP